MLLKRYEPTEVTVEHGYMCPRWLCSTSSDTYMRSIIYAFHKWAFLFGTLINLIRELIY